MDGIQETAKIYQFPVIGRKGTAQTALKAAADPAPSEAPRFRELSDREAEMMQDELMNAQTGGEVLMIQSAYEHEALA
jgi:hypothetical protein